jgi:carnitine O-acetyltransferase
MSQSLESINEKAAKKQTIDSPSIMATSTIIVNGHATKSTNGASDGSKSTNASSTNADGYVLLKKSSSHGSQKVYDRRPSFLRLPSDTYAAQSTLPRLPIPSLDETLARFPRIVEALQTKEEQDETRKVVEEFRYTDGPRLQQLLMDYDQEGARLGTFGSYVEEFWNDSYLAPDSSVVLNLNPFFILEKGPDRKIANDQIQRAAGLAFASLKMASMLKRESLPPDTFKGRPLCMDQFKVLFGTTRIPGGKGVKDHVEHYPDSTHVVVLIRNHIYYFQALWPHDFSVAVDQHDIKDILEAIQKHADFIRNPTNANNAKDDDARFVVTGKNGDKIPVNSCDEALGVLTSLPRREWAEARKMILEGGNEQNKTALHVVDSALFVLVLDENVPKDMNDAAANMLHGTHELVMDQTTNKFVQVGSCCNRWYDKLQLIVMANGKAGVNFEHSSIDGHTALRYASDVYAENVVQFAQSITALIYGNGWIPDNMHAKIDRVATSISDACNRVTHEGEEPHPTLDVFPKKLEFHLPPKVKEMIRYAETNLGDQIIASDTEVLEFFGYGKTLIVKNNLSPDSVVQMCIMIAYYSLYGKFVCAYEPVLTKAFYHGRTEAMRGATPQAKSLCEIWCNTKATKAEKLEALRVATQEHSRMVRDCSNGKGVDRHLFALKCIAERNNVPVPALFKSAAWNALNHTVLSTSNCGNPSLRLFGFGPVVQGT